MKSAHLSHTDIRIFRLINYKMLKILAVSCCIISIAVAVSRDNTGTLLLGGLGTTGLLLIGFVLYQSFYLLIAKWTGYMFRDSFRGAVWMRLKYSEHFKKIIHDYHLRSNIHGRAAIAPGKVTNPFTFALAEIAVLLFAFTIAIWPPLGLAYLLMNVN